MKTMKLLKILVFAALFAGTAMAQNRVLSGMTWNIGIPTGRMANFMDKTSFGGFGIEARNFLSDDFSLGGSLSWNYWSEMTGETIQLQNGALSGTQIRYVNSFPMMVNAHYYIGDRKDQLRPFLGLNVGAYYILQRLDMGIYTIDVDHWHFGIAPEAGILVEMSRDTYLTAVGRYNYAFSSGDAINGSKNVVAYWGINVGVSWMTGWF
jgi:outer membrane protein W